MAVIHDGSTPSVPVDYDAPELVAIDTEPQPARILRPVAVSQEMCSSDAPTAASLFDPAYYEDIVARPFREGTIGEAPVLPGVGLFMPAGLGRREGQGPVPQDRAGLRPRRVHRLHGVRAGLPRRGDPEHRARAARAAAHRHRHARRCPRPSARRCGRRCTRWRRPCASRYRTEKDTPAFHDLVAQAGAGLEVDGPVFARSLGALVENARDLPGRSDPAVLRRDGEGAAGFRRPVLRDDRPLEVHRLPGVHRGLRPRRPDRRSTRTTRADHPAGPVRAPVAAAQHAGAVLRRLDCRPRATSSASCSTTTTTTRPPAATAPAAAAVRSPRSGWSCR